jgi:hypothetical protein
MVEKVGKPVSINTTRHMFHFTCGLHGALLLRVFRKAEMGKQQEWVQIPCPILGKCDHDVAEVDLAKYNAWSLASHEARGGFFNGISLTLSSGMVGHSRHARKAQSAHFICRQAFTYSYLQNPGFKWDEL